jgi:hypothetical protein
MLVRMACASTNAERERYPAAPLHPLQDTFVLPVQARGQAQGRPPVFRLVAGISTDRPAWSYAVLAVLRENANVCASSIARAPYQCPVWSRGTDVGGI